MAKALLKAQANKKQAAKVTKKIDPNNFVQTVLKNMDDNDDAEQSDEEMSDEEIDTFDADITCADSGIE